MRYNKLIIFWEVTSYMKPILDTDRLRELREEKGWSKNVASQKMGLLQSAYLRYENGISVPSYSVLKIMALTLGTTVEYLSGQTDETIPTELLVSCKDKRLTYIIESFHTYSNDEKERLYKYAKGIISKRNEKK